MCAANRLEKFHQLFDPMDIMENIRKFPYKGTVAAAAGTVLYGVFREPLSYLLAGPLGVWLSRGAMLVGGFAIVWGVAWMVAQTCLRCSEEREEC